MGTIHGIYADFDIWAIVLIYMSIGFPVFLLLMGLKRNDKRHFEDFLASTQVHIINRN